MGKEEGRKWRDGFRRGEDRHGQYEEPKDEQLEEGFAVKGKEGSEGRKGRGWRLEA